MRIVFMGTPDFAVPTLERLIADGHDIVGVFTQPDKPKGRGYQLQAPPVKEVALKAGIPVYQPNTFKDGAALEILQELAPELIIVVAYGKLLPKAVLDLPKYGCINVHGSLLPKYRGAAPIQWAVLNGDEVAGVTTMQMDVGLDTGDMLMKTETPIGENETSGELFDRLMVLGAQLCADTIAALQQGTLTPEKQDNDASTYASMLSKEMCPIDWQKTAQEVHNQVRGLAPWPVAITKLGGKRMKIHATRKTEAKPGSAVPGEVISERPLIVACGGGTALEIVELQAEGSKRMKADVYVCGHAVKPGTRLG